MQQAFKAKLPKILPLKASGQNLNNWLDTITIFLEFLDMIYLLWSGHNQVIKNPFAGPEYNCEAVTAEQKNFHELHAKNIATAIKVKMEQLTPAKKVTFEQSARHFNLSVSSDKKGTILRTPHPPKDISSISTSRDGEE